MTGERPVGPPRVGDRRPRLAGPARGRPQRPRGPRQVQTRTAPGYTPPASGASSALGQVFVAEEPSPIQSPDAPTACEISGLARRVG
jgi:hypothetical protein